MSLPQRETYNYSIDESDFIESVDDAWLEFAQANGAPELDREAVIGKSLWVFVSGPDTQKFYRAVFHRVRSEDIGVTFPFRCDSPEWLRFMELSVTTGPAGSLKLTGSLVRQEKRTYVPLIDTLLSRSNQRFSICSICKRVQAFGDWVEAEEALKRFHIFETAHEAQAEYCVCTQCSELATT